jgi:hypothetical protein
MLHSRGVWDVRGEIHSHVDALGGDQRTMPARMVRLAARLPPTRRTPAPHARLTSETIGRGQLRGEGGILLAQRELALEVGDPFRLLGILLAEPLILATQAVDLRRIRARRHRQPRRRGLGVCPLWASPLHGPESTESRRKVQET